MKDFKISVCFVNISGIFIVAVSIIKVSEHSMTRKKQHHTLQNNLMHQKEESQNNNRETIKVKQSAFCLSSSSR